MPAGERAPDALRALALVSDPSTTPNSEPQPLTDRSANTMWGGRFSAPPAEIMEDINASIGFDKALAPQDIRGSKAHAAMLAETGIIAKSDAREIAKGLDQVLAEIEAGTFIFSRKLEDVHMNVESRLAELIGPAAGRLHTARSRNDQVALDFRLFVRDRLDEFDTALRDLMRALATKAEEHAAPSCRASRTCSRRSPSRSATT